MQRAERSTLNPTAAGVAVAAGMGIFPISLLTGQRLLLWMRVCAHHRVLGFVFGGLIVAGGSIGAAEGARATYRYVNAQQKKEEQGALKLCEATSNIQERWPVYAACGVLGFSGPLRSIAPSHLWNLGAFEGGSIPAKGAGYASEAEREQLQRIGKKSGCHTCGTRAGPFNGDHQPPNNITKQRRWWHFSSREQRFYPQCRPCSSRQGASLASNKPAYHFHVRPRPHYLWLPIGLAASWFLGYEE
eukprot:m.6060 g.6060  ORF g.6060 m.6060 type:complete len:245 (+) comp4678_c0_seq1:101-835(+)